MPQTYVTLRGSATDCRPAFPAAALAPACDIAALAYHYTPAADPGPADTGYTALLAHGAPDHGCHDLDLLLVKVAVLLPAHCAATPTHATPAPGPCPACLHTYLFMTKLHHLCNLSLLLPLAHQNPSMAGAPTVALSSHPPHRHISGPGDADGSASE